MRIIAGELKGRRLQTPENYDIRPTTDKVKEAMFSIISHDVPGAVCADLFAGTGNLGLEAISRGAKKCYFCDNSRVSVNIIKQNVKYCGVEEQAVVYAGDFLRGLERIHEKVDVFFLDPPYESDCYAKALRKIKELDLLAEDGIIVAEHGKFQDMPEELEGFEKLKERRYGHIVLSIYG